MAASTFVVAPIVLLFLVATLSRAGHRAHGHPGVRQARTDSDHKLAANAASGEGSQGILPLP